MDFRSVVWKCSSSLGERDLALLRSSLAHLDRVQDEYAFCRDQRMTHDLVLPEKVDRQPDLSKHGHIDTLPRYIYIFLSPRNCRSYVGRRDLVRSSAGSMACSAPRLSVPAWSKSDSEYR